MFISASIFGELRLGVLPQMSVNRVMVGKKLWSQRPGCTSRLHH